MPATLKSRLPEIARELRSQVSRAVKDGAEAVAAEAKVRVPYDASKPASEPHLRDRIHVERRGPAEYAVVAGDDDAWYGHLVKGGSAVAGKGRPPIPAHPFLVPALEAQRFLILLRIQAALEENEDG